MLRQPLFFWSGSLSIQFFNLLTCDLQDAMPRLHTYLRLHIYLYLYPYLRHATPTSAYIPNLLITKRFIWVVSI